MSAARALPLPAPRHPIEDELDATAHGIERELTTEQRVTLRLMERRRHG